MATLPIDDLPIEIEPTLHKTHGACPDCGGIVQTVWGWVHRGPGTHAVYYVRWHVDRPSEEMIWFLCIGGWGDGADASKRLSVGIRCRVENGRPGFMVGDAADTPWGGDPEMAAMFGRLLTRDDVVGKHVATRAFEYVDRILEDDPRVQRFVATGEGMDGHRPGRNPSPWARIGVRLPS